MPSPTLPSLPILDNEPVANDDVSERALRLSRKRRLSDDEEQDDQGDTVPSMETFRGKGINTQDGKDSTRKWSSSDPTTSDVLRDKAKHEVIVCIFTGLNNEQKDSFDQDIARVIEAGLFMEHIQDQPTNEATTHIITNADADAIKKTGSWLCPRVLKYLHGMLSKAWIVRYEWFVDSIHSKTWLPLPHPDYLIQGDTQFGPAPGTLRRREIRSHKSLKLFAHCRMFLYGSFGSSGQKTITKDEVLRLVRDGGAETYSRRPVAKRPSLSSSKPTMVGTSAGEATSAKEYFGPNRSFLYVSEDVRPWEVPLDKAAPIIVCDPTSTPSVPLSALSPADSRKHGWLRDHQAISLTWLLNCISCSLMGAQDIELLYGSPPEIDSASVDEEIRMLSQAWDSWRDKK
ncbi:BRCA1-associated RING domain protein 1 [Mortierella sp. NVP85]|nr:BRCA1-associated RING domain protein 1 [Mortierella sp. NVP85]